MTSPPRREKFTKIHSLQWRHWTTASISILFYSYSSFYDAVEKIVVVVCKTLFQKKLKQRERDIGLGLGLYIDIYRYIYIYRERER